MRIANLALAVFLLTGGTGAVAAVFDGWRYTTEAVGARDADQIAWIDQRDGATVLYAAAGPDYRPRQAAASEANDGVPIEAVSISGDGSWLAYDRGGIGDAAGAGHVSARGVWVSGRGGVPCRIGEGARPTLSPASDRIAWMARGRLMIAPLSADCGAMAAAAQEIAAGGVVAPLWSPDGQALAFEQPTGRARRIGIWRAGVVRWLDNGAQLDVAPAWSPDSRRLAFLRIDPTDDALANQYDEDPPSRFSLMVMSADSLTPAPVWTSPGADGFARQWRSRTTAPVMWLDDQRLAFLSEHEGWQHLYALSVGQNAGPTTPADLSPGLCEVDYADVVAPARLALVDSCAGIDRRRLAVLDTAARTRRDLTPADGVAIQPIAFDHSARLVWRGSAGPVQTVQVLTPTGPVSPEPTPPALFSGVTVESVAITAADQVTTNGQLIHPTQPGRRPAIIFLHGGPQRQTFAEAATSSFYSRFGWLNRALAARGYVVLQLNYRGGTGQGRDFRRIRGVARNGAGEFNDVLAAEAWLARRPDVDPARIGVWGDSWGGWLASLSLARRSDLFRAGVVMSGVYDLSQTSFGPLLNPDARALARASSAAGSIDQWRAPVLIVHGMLDNTVAFSQATELEQALRKRGQAVETLYFPREAHALQLERDWAEMFERSAAFFDRTLKADRQEGGPTGGRAGR